MKKHVLVAGGTQGIGFSIVQALCLEDFKVSAVGRNGRLINKFKEIFGEVAFYKVDVRNLSAVRKVLGEILKDRGEIDILVNCLGYLPDRKPIQDYSLEQLQAAFEVNLRAPFIFCQYVLPEMLKKNAGIIINLSSRATVNPAPLWSGYSLSKAALETFSRSLMRETIGTGIRVYIVNPGATRTVMRRQAYPDENPLALPHPLENTGIYCYLIMNAPNLGETVLDLYDWMEKNPKWRQYGRDLKQRLEKGYGFVS